MYQRTRISFYPLTPDHLALMFTWLSHPEVSRWYGYGAAPQTLAEVEGKYLARIHGVEPVSCYVVAYEGRPVAYVQTYRIDHDPAYAETLAVDRDAAGVDLFIGEETFRYRGFGPVMLQEFVQRIVFASPSTSCCVVAPSTHNRSAIQAYTKAGFRHIKTVTIPDQEDPEYVMMVWPDEIEQRIRELDRARGFAAPPERLSPMTIYVNARAIIEREHVDGFDVLLQRRTKPGESERWELPGGQIEPFESVLRALEREIAEETGLILALVHGQQSYVSHHGGQATVETFEPLFAYQTTSGPVDSLGFYFRCQVEGEINEAGDAAKQPTWFSITELEHQFRQDSDQFDWLTQAALERYLTCHRPETSSE